MINQNLNKWKGKKNLELTKEENELVKKVQLHSEMYNHDVEKLERRDDSKQYVIMWATIIGFTLFLIILIFILIFTH